MDLSEHPGWVRLSRDGQRRLEWKLRMMSQMWAAREDVEQFFNLASAGLEAAFNEGITEAEGMVRDLSAAAPHAIQKRALSVAANGLKDLNRRNAALP